MTPDQVFARWVRASLLLFAVVFCYFLAADLWMPVTPQSRVIHPVIRVAPQVAGQVVEVAVEDNQHVVAGDLLLRIDPRPYALAVQQAQLVLEAAERDNSGIDASIAAAQARVRSAQVRSAELARERDRLQRLLASHNVSRQSYEQVVASSQSAQAELASLQAQVRQLQVQRGEGDQGNLRLRQAQNALEQAMLNLSFTEVRAQSDGVVSNLQVRPGTYAVAGAALMGLILLVTMIWVAPVHGELLDGFDPEQHDTLMASNLVRTLLWTARGGVAMAMVWVLLSRQTDSVTDLM